MFENIDGRLDMSLFMSTSLKNIDSSFFSGTESVPMSLHLHKGETAINFFIERGSKYSTELMKYYSHIVIGDYIMVTKKVELPVVRVLYENISSIGTMVFGGLYAKGEDLMIDYRFHNSDRSKVAEIVKLLVSLNTEFKIGGMGKSKGLRDKLSEIASRLPLTAVRFGYRDGGSENQILEWRGASDPYGAVSFGEDGKGKIAKLDISKSVIAPFLRSILKDQIQPAGYFEEHIKGRVHALSILPSFLVKPFLLRMFDKAESSGGIEIESIEPFEEVRESL